MNDGFQSAQEITARILRMTVEVWHQPPNGALCEPVNHAWRRLFGEPIESQRPILFMPATFEGTSIACVLYPRGRVLVEDPCQGRTIRVIKPEHVAARVEIGNLADLLASNQPAAAWVQRERPSGYASVVDPRTAVAIDILNVGDEAAKHDDPASAFRREAEAFLGERIAFLVQAPEEPATHEELHHARVGGSTQEFLVSAESAA